MMAPLKADSSGKRSIELSPVRPNAGIAAAYHKELRSLADAMTDEAMRMLKRCYKREEGAIALDASPASILRGAMKALSSTWLKRFDELADKLSRDIIGRSADNVDVSLRRALRKGGFTVKFKPTKAQKNVLEASIAENVALIKSIPEKYLTEVEGIVMRSVSKGFDAGQMAAQLQKRRGITQRRAYTIASDQTRKATAAFARVRSVELGITEGIWKHSAGGKEPRKSHKDFSGKVFDLREGHDFGDGFGPVLPGEAINCRCYYTPVIKL